MKLFPVILCCILITHGLSIYKKELRSVHKLEKNRIIAHMIIDDFNRIYNDIQNAAKLTKKECRFDLRCSYTLDAAGECKENSNNDLLYIMDHIQFEMPYKSYTHFLIKKINQTFPDTIITQIKKPCCAYIISW